MVKAQLKIQQMAFMILAVFVLFILVGLFFISFKLKDIKKSARELKIEQAISSLSTLANMPELNCGRNKELCIDEDKARVMAGKREYSSFWPVSSIRIYKIYPEQDRLIKCPAVGCNYYEIFNSGQKNIVEHSTFITLCQKIKKQNYVYDECNLAKLVVGTKK